MNQTRPGAAKMWTFIVLMLALAVTCAWLGTWQLQRLAEKEALIAAVDDRLDAIPVPLPPAAISPAPDIRIELRRGPTSVSVNWPLEAAEQCAVWMRELLK